LVLASELALALELELALELALEHLEPKQGIRPSSSSYYCSS